MTRPRTAAPDALYSGLFGEPGENAAPNVATGPCHTDDCSGLHWTDDEAEYHLFTDRTMQAVDPAEWLGRHPEAFLNAAVPVPRNVLAYLNGPAGPGGPLPAQPIRCTDPDCVDYGKGVSPDHTRVTEIDGLVRDLLDDDEGPLPTVMVDNLPDDPWEGRPVAKGTFRQRWLLGPKFIRRWHLPRTDYYDAVLTVDVWSWVFGFEVWSARRGGYVQLGPIRLTIDESPF